MFIPRVLRYTLILLGLALLMLAVPPGAGIALQEATQTPAAVTTDGAETLETLRRAIVPPRDRIDLARRLLGVTVIPTPPPVSPVYAVGDTREFRAANLSTNQRFTLQARLWHTTPHLYLWFEEGFVPDMQAVRRSAENFDNVIYPTVRAYFGREASPGIDGDTRLHILHARNLGAGVAAYFDAESEFPRTVAPQSNEAQMFFVNLDTMANLIGTPGYEGTLAHEFQHMVHANKDPNESVWLDEGMAELAAALCGYREGSPFVGIFANAPETQLNTWPKLGNAAPHYGASYLFMTYYLQRFGKEALRKLVANPLNDLEGVRDTLRQIGATDPATGQPVTVEDFFADWVIANLLNTPEVEDGRYAYAQLPAQLPALRIGADLAEAMPQAVEITQWGTAYVRLAAPGRYRLTFAGESTVRVVPTAARSGVKFWWSNRGDQINTRLTRRFDLRGVSTATLRFWLWYQIEEDWDFGYVQVSTDGGSTWTALGTQHSVPAGDNNPYGPAYTGMSGSKAPAWQLQTLDLTPYAGREILVRFEYMTDAAVNDPGMAIDDISIPEIGYRTDAESGDDGWVAEGWVRIANVLPQRYLVQRVEYGPTPRVARLLGPEDGTHQTWTLVVGEDVDQVVLAISGLTEYTTEKAAARLTLRRQ